MALEAAANEDTFQSLFLDESQMKKRGRPKKTALNQTFVNTTAHTKTQASLSKKKSMSTDKPAKVSQSNLTAAQKRENKAH